MCSRLYFSTSLAAWVPLPEPGGPKRIKLIMVVFFSCIMVMFGHLLGTGMEK